MDLNLYNKGKRNRKVNQSVDWARLERIKGPVENKREGKIREIAKMVDSEDDSLENELLSIMNKADAKKRRLYNTTTIDSSGGRYYTGKGPNLDLIKKQAAERQWKKTLFAENMKQSYGTFLTSTEVPEPEGLPQIKPLLKRRLDTI